MVRDDLAVTGSVDINVPAATVWKGLTDPAIIKEYLFGTETITDWKPGSEIIFQGEYNGTSYKDKGVVQENIPGEKLSYTYWSAFSGLPDEPDNYSLVTYTVIPKGDNLAELIWTMEGYATQEGYEHSKSGMPAFMDKVKAVIEK